VSNKINSHFGYFQLLEGKYLFIRHTNNIFFIEQEIFR
jgi:hypothetical protein